jgi:hypothetical protein
MRGKRALIEREQENVAVSFQAAELARRSQCGPGRLRTSDARTDIGARAAAVVAAVGPPTLKASPLRHT